VASRATGYLHYTATEASSADRAVLAAIIVRTSTTSGLTLPFVV